MQDIDDGATENAEESKNPLWSSWPVIALVFAGLVLAGRLSPYKPISNVFNSFNWVTEHAISVAANLFDRWGYLTVFLAPLLENTLFVGAIVPGTLVMLLAGLAVNDGLISYWWTIPLAVAGAMIGDTISYSMGRWGAQRLGQESRMVRWAEGMREPLMENSLWLIMSYHFAGYSRLIGPAAAGFLRMPLPRWMLLDYVGVFIWVVVYITGGWLIAQIFGLRLDEHNDRSVQIFEVILFVFFAIAVVSVMRTQRRRTHSTTEEDISV